jgi:ABC-type multidrug transport system fused ATPase/permease subunit
MGLVQQEPVLFNLPIRDNIAYGNNTQEVTQDQIEAAARKANIHDLITSLPEVYFYSFDIIFYNYFLGI